MIARDRLENKIEPTIKGIIFDLDGTLYHMRWYLRPLFTLFLFPHCFRLPALMAARKPFAGRDMKTGTNLLNAIAQEMNQGTTLATTQSIVSWIHTHFYPSFERVMPFLQGSRPGLKRTLRTLKKRKYHLAVLSDFAAIKERLAGLQIPPTIFDTILSSETEGALKPNPQPFLHISTAWNIPPHNILVIGDKHETDGLGAHNAGMQFVQISDAATAAYNCHTWKTLQKFLEHLPELSKVRS